MTEANKGLGAVSLPAGSYEAEKLSKGLETAVTAKPEDQQGKVDAAVAAARTGTVTDRDDPALLPDHVFVDVDNGHGGTERRQVFSPPLASQHRGAELPNQGTVVETDADAEKARGKAIADAVDASKPKKAEAQPEPAAESRTGAADPVLAAEATTAPAAAAAQPSAEPKK